MDFSSLFLAIGILTTTLGFLMVLLSLRASPDELEHQSTGIIFIGPIPIILGGKRMWITVAMIMASIIVFIFLALYQPNLVGW
ncbi:MAG: TIGR00304 family membrane protein [Candidatus Bathyarchaeia archaeon]